MSESTFLCHLATPGEVPKKKNRLTKLQTLNTKEVIPRAKLKQISGIAVNAMRLLQTHEIISVICLPTCYFKSGWFDEKSKQS